MIIFKGFGFLIFVIVFGISLVFNLVSNAWWGEEYWKAHKWPFAISLFLSSVLCWFVGRAVENRASRIRDLAKEEFVADTGVHSFFFLPMSWWAPILAVIGAVVLVIELTKQPEQERSADQSEVQLVTPRLGK